MTVACEAICGEARPWLRGESSYEAEGALNELMLGYQGPIYRFLLVILQDGDAALDCAQETFIRAYEHLCRGRPINASWLYKVARSRAMNEFHRKKRFQLR